MGQSSKHTSDRQVEPHPGQRAATDHHPGYRGRSNERLLSEAVTQDIIPRLVGAHPPLAVPARAPQPQVSEQEVLAFADLVLQADEASLRERVQALRERGIAHHRILLDLLMPVATHMGRLWEHDLCDFHDVTLAVGRLQRLLRHPHAEPTSAQNEGRCPRRILLGTCQGEQHTFGVSMVAEFFHQAGWDVTISFLGTDLSPVQLAREQWFDVAGLSLGSDALLPEFVRLIEGLRSASVNRDLSIIAGGAMFALHPSYAHQLRVDAVITDASHAPSQAEQLLTRRKSTAHETAQ